MARRVLELRAGEPGGGDFDRAAAAGRTLARSVFLKAFHAKKVDAIKAEGKDEMAYWLELVPQLVQLPLEA